MKSYTLGKFEEAIEEFEKAYELRSEPVFLYNIAQSHRQNKNPQRAIFFYRRYLEAEPTAKNRADIEQRIEELQAQIDAKTESTPPTTTPPAPPPVVVAPTPPPPPQVAQPVAISQTDTSSTPSEGRGLRIAGIAVGAVGVAGVVAGIILGVHANSLNDEATKSGSYFDSSKYESAKTYQDLEWVSFGVGAAGIITGGVLYYLGIRQQSASSVAIRPIVAPGAGGAALYATF